MNKRHIWIYDDDAIIESDLQLVLLQGGYQVFLKSKEEIVESLHKEDSHDKADLVICNSAPIMSLDKTCRLLCPLVLITGHMPQFLKSIPDHFDIVTLYKPFLPIQVIQLVGEL